MTCQISKGNTMTHMKTLSETLADIINLNALNTKAGKFVRPFTSDGRPARFWEICCFVYDRKSTTMTDINRYFYGSMRSDWHSVIMHLCQCGLLRNIGGTIRVGSCFEKYRSTVISAMIQ